MSLKTTLPNLEGLSPEIASLYIADGAEFKLDIEGTTATTTATTTDDGLKKLQDALSSERQANANLKGLLNNWNELGTDPAAIKAKLAETGTGTKKKADDSEMKEMHEKYTAMISEKDKEIATAKTNERKAIVDVSFKAGLIEAGFNADGVSLLPIKYGERIRVNPEKGNVEILNELGGIMLGTGTENVTISEFCSTLATNHPGLVKSDRVGGAGITQNDATNTGGKTMSRQNFEALDANQKMLSMKSGTTLTD